MKADQNLPPGKEKQLGAQAHDQLLVLESTLAQVRDLS